MKAPRRTVLALIFLFALAGGGWLFSRGSPPRVQTPTKPPDDDLEMLAAMLDAGAPTPAGHDALGAGKADLYVLHGADGTLEAQPKAGGATRVLARLGGPVWGMAVGGASLFVATAHALMRVPVSGGPAATILDGLSQPRAIVSDGRWVFVVDVEARSGSLLRASSVIRVPAAGGHGDELGRYQGEVTNVALDGANAYWADRLEGNVLTAPIEGGAPRVLASDRGLPGEVAVDGDAVYWVEKRSESLWSVPKAGGAAHQVVQDFAGFSHLAMAGSSVVWVNEAAVDGFFRVLRVPSSGGEASAASPPTSTIDALAYDGSSLYWLHSGVAEAVPAAE
jgi:hypothetical protein